MTEPQRGEGVLAGSKNFCLRKLFKLERALYIMEKPKESTWKKSCKQFYAPLKKPWFWAIVTPLAAVMTSYNVRYLNQAEEIDKQYNKMYGRTNVQVRNDYWQNREDIYKMLDYLDANGVKVRDDMVRLSRGLDNFFDKLPFYSWR